LGHCSFEDLQRLFLKGILPSKFPSLVRCESPKCADCEIARARRRDVRTIQPTRRNAPRKELSPGDCISIYQYVCTLRGRSCTAKTISSCGKSFSGGTIFCDNASKFVMCFIKSPLLHMTP
jgi:hypothetical protein